MPKRSQQPTHLTDALAALEQAGVNLDAELLARIELSAYAEHLLGERSWWLLWTFGRVMAGEHSGLYVSALPCAKTRQFVDELMQGSKLPVHLMHRHASGQRESSELRFVKGRLVMVFADREELA